MESVTPTASCAHLSIGLNFVSVTEEPYMGKPYVRFREGMLNRLSTRDAFYSTCAERADRTVTVKIRKGKA